MNKRERWSPKRVEQEILEAMSILDIDYIPSVTGLRKCGKPKLYNAIRKLGLDYWSKRLGVPTASDIKWHTDNDIEQSIHQAMRELSLDRIPSKNDLDGTRFSWLSGQIYTRGGVKAWSERLDVKSAQEHYKEAGWWDVWENMEKEIRNAMHDLNINRMPTTNELASINRKNIVNALSKHGGSYKCAEQMGIEVSTQNAPSGWWTLKRIRSAIQPTVDEFGRMPTKKELDDRGLTKLSSVVSNKGYQIVANALGIDMKDCTIRQALNKENEVIEIIREMGLKAEPTAYKAPFDILVENQLRIDVKMGSRSTKRPNQFIFRMDAKNYQSCDLYILCATEGESRDTVDTYWIPADLIPFIKTTDTGLSISSAPRWHLWRNNLNILHSMLKKESISSSIELLWAVNRGYRASQDRAHLYYKYSNSWVLSCNNHASPDDLYNPKSNARQCHHCLTSYNQLQTLAAQLATISICESQKL
jgi:hypothetical protein